MRYAGLTSIGRISTWLASCFAPPYKSRCYLAHLNPKGYIAPSAIIDHSDLIIGKYTYIGDRVVIYNSNSGAVNFGEEVQLYSDIIIETGDGGSVNIGAGTNIQPRCSLSAYKGSIHIGCRVEIAPNCAFYSYDHGFEPEIPIMNQPLKTRGGIIVGDEAWLGFGVIVLDGVRIGKGAVIGAGSVVTKNIPENAIAVGVPARVVKMRHKAEKTAQKNGDEQ